MSSTEANMKLLLKIVVILLGLILFGLSMQINIPADAAVEKIKTGAVSEETRQQLRVWNIARWGGLLILIFGFGLPTKQEKKPKEETTIRDTESVRQEWSPPSNQDWNPPMARETMTPDEREERFWKVAASSLVALLFVSAVGYAVLSPKSSTKLNTEATELEVAEPTIYPAEFYGDRTIKLIQPKGRSQTTELARKIGLEQNLIPNSYTEDVLTFIYPDQINNFILENSRHIKSVWLQIETFNAAQPSLIDDGPKKAFSRKFLAYFDCAAGEWSFQNNIAYEGNLLTGKQLVSEEINNPFRLNRPGFAGGSNSIVEGAYYGKNEQQIFT